jgi:hypothetical protein
MSTFAAGIMEKKTALMPDVIAETVVQEVERFLRADLPPDFAERLEAKARYLYGRHRHFTKVLKRQSGRDSLYMFMRHWTAGWLKREENPLYPRLPKHFAIGLPL